MPQSDFDKLNRVEELKTKLFSQKFQTKIEHRDKFTQVNTGSVPDTWPSTVTEKVGSGEKVFMKTPIFKNFFLFSVAFFVLAIGYASYVFFVGGNTVSKDNIDITVIGNNFTAGGEELSLLIGITNKNSSALELVDLVIEYPKGAAIGEVDTSVETDRTRVSLGTIPAGSVRNENVKLILFGEQGSVLPVKISIEYRVEGSNAIFVKEKPYDVSVKSTPVNLTIEAPSSVSSNQEIVLDVKTTLNTTRPASQVLLKLDYPVGFQFISAKPAPTLGNNVWSMGDLAPGAERNIAITGKMLNVFEGEEKIFRAWSGTQSKLDKSMIDVVFTSLTHSLKIKKPFIETKLLVNGMSGREHSINSKTTVRGEIEFTNNLDTTIRDLVIEAKIVGNAVDRRTIGAERGFYNSATNTITWDKSFRNELRAVNPGDSGNVQFSFSPLSLVSAGSTLPDPSISIVVNVSGHRSADGSEDEDINNSQSAVIRITSDVGFVARGLYYSGAFTNSGPVPPEVEKETTYTIVWTLSNSANNISNASITSSLPAWMRFVGPFSPTTEDLDYNASTKEITWNIGTIPKGTGTTSANTKSVSFQVAISPSLSQVGTVPYIINEAVLTGHDDFANVDVRVNKTPLSARLENDPQFPPSGGVVVE